MVHIRVVKNLDLLVVASRGSEIPEIDEILVQPVGDAVLDHHAIANVLVEVDRPVHVPELAGVDEDTAAVAGFADDVDAPVGHGVLPAVGSPSPVDFAIAELHRLTILEDDGLSTIGRRTLNVDVVEVDECLDAIDDDPANRVAGHALDPPFAGPIGRVPCLACQPDAAVVAGHQVNHVVALVRVQHGVVEGIGHRAPGGVDRDAVRVVAPVRRDIVGSVAAGTWFAGFVRVARLRFPWGFAGPGGRAKLQMRDRARYGVGPLIGHGLRHQRGGEVLRPAGRDVDLERIDERTAGPAVMGPGADVEGHQSRPVGPPVVVARQCEEILR